MATKKAPKRKRRPANRVVEILRNVVKSMNRKAHDGMGSGAWLGMYTFKPQVELAKAIKIAAEIDARKTKREKRLPGDVGGRKPSVRAARAK